MANDKKLPKISVVTICRNDCSGLEGTLASVRNQVYDNLQHIIVDGASTDGTLDLLKAYTASYEINWTSEPDGGIFDAMNKGIARSDGELVVFMNSGDEFSDRHTLSFVGSDWAQHGWSWGYGEMRYRDLSGRLLSGTTQVPFQKLRFQLGLRFVPHQSMYMTRSLLSELGGYDPKFAYACDQELALRAANVSEPAVWVRYMSDFTVGGVHSQSSPLHRELLMHSIRKSNAVVLGNSVILDYAFSVVMAGFRLLRSEAAKRVSIR